MFFNAFVTLLFYLYTKKKNWNAYTLYRNRGRQTVYPGPALRKDGHVISGSGEKVAAGRRSEMEENGWYAGQITADIEAVITGAEISSDNLLLQAATDMGISTYTIPEFLYEFSRYKTRVVAGGLRTVLI